MSRLGAWFVGCAVVFACSGCVGLVGNTVETGLPDRQAVVIDGQLYVVDVNTGEVSHVGSEAVAQAEPFEPAGPEGKENCTPQ